MTLETATDVTIAGRPMKFVGDAGDGYAASLAEFHAAAPRLEYYLRHHLPPDAVCLDIGSNIGLTAILLSLYSPNGQIYCFEASPRNARNLRRNLELNDIRNCRIIDSAVGAHNGTLCFRETNFCAGSHVAPLSAVTPQDPAVIGVPVVTIDGFLQAQGLAGIHIDFMKLDVEGFEPAVLAGASATIERTGCPIFMEFNSWCLLLLQHFSPLAFATKLLDCFEVRRVQPDGSLAADGDASVGAFLHGNLMHHGCVDDILIRLKPGRQVPSLLEMTKSGEDLDNAREVQKLRAELAARRHAA
jgi:FkbM family methyltransferase